MSVKLDYRDFRDYQVSSKLKKVINREFGFTEIYFVSQETSSNSLSKNETQASPSDKEDLPF